MSTSAKVIDGPESMPFSIWQKRIGAECADVVSTKAGKIQRKRSRYVAHENIDNDEIYNRILGEINHLEEFDPRFTSILVHGAYNQQRIGVPQPTEAKRQELGLPDPFDDPAKVGGQTFDSLYMECVRVMCELVKEGFAQYSDDELESMIARVRLKNNVNRGAPSCARGDEANLLFVKDIFPKIGRASCRERV